MILQARDLDIVQLCYEQQFLTVDHLLPLFRGGQKDVVLRRIKKLQAAGLISVEKAHVSMGRTSLLRLTKKGNQLGAMRSAYDLPRAHSLDYRTLEHDTLVTTLRLRLRELWDFTWVPERALKDRYEIVPDGLVQFASGLAFAIEVENSMKGATRQRAILDTWDRTAGVQMVIFVCTKPQVFDAWQRYLTEGPRRIAYALLRWEELVAGHPVAWSPKGPLPLFERRGFG